MTPRERAWSDIHDLLPDGWPVGPPSYDPGHRRWNVTAISPMYSGRSRPPAVITGHGEDELPALTELAIGLRELRATEERMQIEEMAGAAFLAGPGARGCRYGRLPSPAAVAGLPLSPGGVWPR